jgi:hypothetical protein
MKTLLTSVLVVAALAGAGCSRSEPGTALALEAGRDVTLGTTGGVTVSGRLVEVKPEHVIVEQRDGARRSVARREITTVSAATARETSAPATSDRPAAATAAGAEAAAAEPDRRAGPVDRDHGRDERATSPSTGAAAGRVNYRSVTVPSGTLLPVELTTALGSDSSRVEDPVRATLRRALVVDGVEVLPAGTRLLGTVTSVARAARVKGRASIAFRFTAIEPPGDGRVAIRTETVSRRAAATKKQDAAKIGGAAAGGAIVGGILGGGDGAAKGAAIGGAAGTGVVLSTRGAEVRLGPGAPVAVRLAAPATLRVPAGG